MSTVPRQPLKRSVLAVCHRAVGLVPTLDAHYPVKRARTAPDRFGAKIPLPRGGTVRDRTFEERLLQVAWKATRSLATACPFSGRQRDHWQLHVHFPATLC